MNKFISFSATLTAITFFCKIAYCNEDSSEISEYQGKFLEELTDQFTCNKESTIHIPFVSAHATRGDTFDFTVKSLGLTQFLSFDEVQINDQDIFEFKDGKPTEIILKKPGHYWCQFDTVRANISVVESEILTQFMLNGNGVNTVSTTSTIIHHNLIQNIIVVEKAAKTNCKLVSHFFQVPRAGWL